MEHLVSVIIPTCEREKEFKRAIDSVKNQTYSNIEIIVMDSSRMPKDESFFNDEYIKIRYFYDEKSKDISKARNQGVALSIGDFITFLNDSDIWEPTKIEKQISLMTENPNVPLCLTYSHDLRFGQDHINRQPKVITHKMLLKSFILSPISSYMIRKYPFDVLDKSNGYYLDVGLKSLQGHDVAIQLTKHHDVLCVPEVLVTQIDDRKLSDIYKGIKQIYNKHKSKYHIIIPIRLFSIGILLCVSKMFGNKFYSVILSRINCK